MNCPRLTTVTVTAHVVTRVLSLSHTVKGLGQLVVRTRTCQESPALSFLGERVAPFWTFRPDGQARARRLRPDTATGRRGPDGKPRAAPGARLPSRCLQRLSVAFQM